MATIIYTPVVATATTIETATDSNMAIDIFFDGVIWVFKKVIGFVGACGTDLDGLFIVVAIVGVFLIMAGFKNVGTKLTSGSILGYIVCKVVDLVC